MARFRSFLPDAGRQYWFSPGDTVEFTTLSDSAWNGTAGNLVKIKSKSDRSPFFISIPSDTISMSYINPRDCKILNGWLDLRDGTSLGGGGNSRMLFPSMTLGE